MLNESGQTVLEVLIALTLIILFLSGVVIIELVALRNVQYGQNKSVATKLANQQLERARVIRDSVGIDAITGCNPCYIDNFLTPTGVSSAGIYNQSLTVLSDSSDCPRIEVEALTPTPAQYKLTVDISWIQNTAITLVPAPKVVLSTCLAE